MADPITLARPYARAAFMFAKEVNQIDDWFLFLAFLVDITKRSDLLSLVVNPQIEKSTKVKLIEQICEKVMVNKGDSFLKLVAYYDRFSCFYEILQEFNRLVLESRDNMNIIVSAPYPVTEIEEKKIVKGLLKSYPDKNISVKTK